MAKAKKPKTKKLTVSIKLDDSGFLQSIRHAIRSTGEMIFAFNDYRARFRARMFFWFLIFATIGMSAFAAHEFVFAMAHSIEAQVKTP